MKKTLFTLFTAISFALLYCPAALALTEDEAAAAVGAQGKDAVSGNLFLWLLCAIAFLKVSTKLDGILHSLGIGVSRSPGSMLSEALLAFRGFEIGKAFMGLGAAKAAATTTNTKTAPSNTFAGGLSGMVSRHCGDIAAAYPLPAVCQPFLLGEVFGADQHLGFLPYVLRHPQPLLSRWR